MHANLISNFIGKQPSRVDHSSDQSWVVDIVSSMVAAYLNHWLFNECKHNASF